MSATRAPTPAKCRSCGAAIHWATTAGGKKMPVDAAPVEDGGLVLKLTSAGELKVEAFSSAAHGPYWPRRVSHFVSCPQAHQHRRAS